MAYTGTFCTSGQILIKAGENYDSTINTEENLSALALEAESYINSVTRYNWTDALAGLNADVKYLLSEAASNLAAIYVVSYNMAGYTSRTEAELLLNVLKVRSEECIEALKDIKVQTFVLGA